MSTKTKSEVGAMERDVKRGYAAFCARHGLRAPGKWSARAMKKLPAKDAKEAKE